MEPTPQTPSFGVLADLPPRLLAVGAVWVCAADGIFAGFWSLSEFVNIAGSLVVAGAVFLLLLVLSSSHFLGILVAVAFALLYGWLIYSFSGIAPFAALIALQVGLMHYCALRIVGHHRARRHRASAGRAPSAGHDVSSS